MTTQMEKFVNLGFIAAPVVIETVLKFNGAKGLLAIPSSLYVKLLENAWERTLLVIEKEDGTYSEIKFSANSISFVSVEDGKFLVPYEVLLDINKNKNLDLTVAVLTARR